MFLLSSKDKERFWSRVDIREDNECWPWTAAVNKGGYGSFWIGEKSYTAHRVAWLITHGPIKRSEEYHGTCVLHKCDNRRCCNPSDLFLGTQSDNIADMILKGRQVPSQGEYNGNASLTEAEVIRIRAMYDEGGWSQRALAREFEESKSMIGYITRYENWEFV